MIHLCRHILPGGKLCEQAAVKDTLFCRHHSAVKAALAREKAAAEAEIEDTPIAFVYPEDRAAVQLNYFLVLQALNDKRIDNRTANSMNRLLRSCDLNLRQGALAETDREKAVKNVVTLPDGEEVGVPHQAMEALDEPLEHGEACGCWVCAEEFRGAAREQHHAACRCGACFAEGEDGSREAHAVNMCEKDPEPYRRTADRTDKVAGGLPREKAPLLEEVMEAYRVVMTAPRRRDVAPGGDANREPDMKEALLEEFKRSMGAETPCELAAGAA